MSFPEVSPSPILLTMMTSAFVTLLDHAWKSDITSSHSHRTLHSKADPQHPPHKTQNKTQETSPEPSKTPYTSFHHTADVTNRMRR